MLCVYNSTILILILESNSTSILASFLSSMGGNKVNALLNPAAENADYYDRLNHLVLAVTQAMYPFTVSTFWPGVVYSYNKGCKSGQLKNTAITLLSYHSIQGFLNPCSSYWTY